MCHIGLPPTNRNWGYFTAIFLSGSWTVSSNGTQVSSFSPKMAWFYRRKTHERSVLDIRLSSRSKRCPGILLKILVLNLCFKVTNYAKSWFHGHSCTTLPITTQLGVYCHSCAAWGDVEAYLCWYWCHWNTQENHLDANFHQSPQPTSKDQGFILSFYIWSKNLLIAHHLISSLSFHGSFLHSVTAGNMCYLTNKPLEALHVCCLFHPVAEGLRMCECPRKYIQLSMSGTIVSMNDFCFINNNLASWVKIVEEKIRLKPCCLLLTVVCHYIP